MKVDELWASWLIGELRLNGFLLGGFNRHGVDDFEERQRAGNTLQQLQTEMQSLYLELIEAKERDDAQVERFDAIGNGLIALQRAYPTWDAQFNAMNLYMTLRERLGMESWNAEPSAERPEGE